MAPAASYVLPIRCGPEVPAADLTGYLEWLAGRVEVVVVDGSAPAAFAAHARLWRELPIRHVAPDPDLDGANGKVAGVVTGLRAGEPRPGRDRRRRRALRRRRPRAHHLVAGRAELVRPRTTSPRGPGTRPGTAPAASSTGFSAATSGHAGGAAEPRAGRRRVRRRRPLREPGAHADRTGGRRPGLRPLDLYVARRPPPAGKFWSQRVRQAYDDFAQPLRLVAALSAAPALVAAARRSRRPWLPLAGASVAAMVTAEAGRRRAGGRRFFPVTASLLAPVWVLERALCSWLAVAVRLRLGGCPYAGRVVPRAAHSRRALRNRRQPVEAAPTSIPR